VTSLSHGCANTGPVGPVPPGLAALQGRLASIVEASDDAIISWTLDGRIDSWNPAAERMYGFTAAEAIGQPAMTLLAPDGKTRESGITDLALRGAPVSHVETVRIRKDGSAMDVVVSVVAIRDDQGRITGACEIARDISEQKRAELHLLATVGELKNIKAALDEHSIVAITDAAGKITYVNDKFCAISQYSREELIGRDHRIINSRTHSKAFFQDLWTTIRSGSVWRGEIRNRAKDGSHITQRKATEEMVKKSAADLAEKNKELETIVYTVSHDLRSPLVNVQGFSRQLSRVCEGIRASIQRHPEGVPPAELAPAVNESIPQALRFIQAGVSKMDSLLNGLLRYSRTGRLELSIQPVVMDTLVGSVLAAAKFQLDEAGATVEVTPLPDCRADAVQMSQVFANLIDNARKYRAPGRPLQLRISGQVENGLAIYQVADNGIGIPAEHQPRVFELFHRLDPDQTPGEGLGLTIAQRVMERQGGRIWVESREGAGSTFFVSLPAA
jgi:chemotaxis family two-component system sensor kinase Cph1